MLVRISNNNSAVKALVFIALAAFLVGAVAATIIPAQQADAQGKPDVIRCPEQSPGGPQSVIVPGTPGTGCSGR